MSAELISTLVEGTLATTAALLMVLVLRQPLRRHFGAGCVPLLWSLVPLAQLAVWLPAPLRETALALPLLPAAAQPVLAAPGDPAPVASLAPGDWIALLWLLGALLCAGYFLLLQWRFRQRLGRLRETAPGVLQAETSDLGPAVLGLLRPRIILPADFSQRFCASQQALIMAHERSHLRRGDIVANAIASALRCLYWFNPLLHYAADRLRHDHELASDADVMQRHPHARRHYADTLLNVQLAVPGLPVGCLWQSSHPLKERILMLSTLRTTPLRRRAGALLASSLALSLATLAWASQPNDQQVDPDTDASAMEAGPSYASLSPPAYPATAIASGEEGKVILKVLVAVDGSAKQLEVAAATPPGAFDDAAIAAVRNWKFNPATRDGKPVEAWVQVPICFSLKQDESISCSAGPEALDGIYRIAPELKPAG